MARKKFKLNQLEEKLNKVLENELMDHWKEFREVVLDDNEKPFKYKKIDVCQCIKNWLKTGKPELPDEIKISKERPEILSWNNIVSYEKFFKSK